MGESNDDRDNHYVNREKRLITRALHLQFRYWLRVKPFVGSYPDQPNIDNILRGEDKGIEEHIDVANICIIMTDGRYYRQQRYRSSTSQFGKAQKLWIDTLLQGHNGIKILCSGTALRVGKECWAKYNDLAWLRQRNLTHTVILSGDTHRNNFTRHSDLQNMLEVTSSGAARPPSPWPLGAKDQFGFLEINGLHGTASLFPENRKRPKMSIFSV